MRDITRYIEQFTQEFRSGCGSGKSGVCKNTAGCGCALRAEVWAYICGLIPPEYHRLDLSNFDGKVNKKTVLPTSVVREAKKRIVAYCWGKIKYEPNMEFNSVELMKKSKLDDRRNNGQSLVIFGDDIEYKTKATGEPIIMRRKVGRSFLAACVMKEVIKRRFFEGHAADTYDWVQFHTLRARVLAKDADSTMEYQTCDWLVVDCITKDERGTENMRVYANNMLDTVFMERIENRLPTILVCNFDVNQVSSLEDCLGIGIAQIIRDNNTMNVSLSQTTNE